MEYAYIAGFLDGGGTIRKHEVWRDSTKVRKTPRYGFEIVFWNTDLLKQWRRSWKLELIVNVQLKTIRFMVITYEGWST